MTEKTPAQHEAVTHPGGPLLIVAGAGAGQDAHPRRALRLARRARHAGRRDPRARRSRPPRRTTCASGSRRASGAATSPTRSCTVTTFQAFCARLLREEALEAGVDPFAAPVTAADRLALLLERIDELPLASHDLRGNPSALLGSIVQRIDGLKDELITAADYAAWAEKLPEDGEPARARAAREREFAAIYAAHDRMLAEAGTLDFGDLVLHAFRLLRTKPHIRQRLGARFRHVLVDEFQDTNFAQNLLLRLLVAEHGNVTAAGDDDQAIFRFRGASTKNLADFRTEWPGRRGRAPARELPLRRAHPRRRARRRRARPRADREAAATRAPARRRARSRSGAARTSARRPRRSPPTSSADRSGRASGEAPADEGSGRGRVAPEDVCVLVRSVRGEGQAVAAALEERAVPYRLSGAAAFFQRAEVRDLIAWLRLLVDPGDAGAVVRALARPPIELRAIDLARCTQIARRRKLDMVAALGAAMESPQIPPEARERIAVFLRLYRGGRRPARLDAPRPLRAPADRAARPAPPAAVRGVDRGRRAARQPGEVRRARRRLPAPLAAGDRARVRPLDRRGRRRRAARGGGGRRRAPARRAGDDDARRQGPRVRPRLRARPDGRAHARPAPARARADPGRADQGGAAARLQGRARRRRCGACCTSR